MKLFHSSLRNIFILIWAFLSLLPLPAPGKPADNIPISMLPEKFQRSLPGQRPSRQLEYLSPKAYFLLHYDISAYHAVPLNYNYDPQIPDYVFCAAQYLDECYSILHDSLGFDAPPIDNYENPEIDVYFSRSTAVYGETYLEQEREPQVWTSYLTLNSNLEDPSIFNTTGLNGLRVTCAHELFHVFQLGYRFRQEDRFYFEMSSVWFEEYMYPDINDYHSYFIKYSQNWHYALNHANLWYNNAGFNLSMDSRYSDKGDNVIKAIWQRIRTQPALDAISAELQARGGTMEQALCDWGIAQVLCSSYVATNYPYAFEDAAELPSISFSRYPKNVKRSAKFSIGVPATPMTTYYRVVDQEEKTLLLDFSFPAKMKVQLIALNGNESRVFPLEQSPLILDGSLYREWILSVGAIQNNSDSGRIEIWALQDDRIAGIAPNPLGSFRDASLHYVLSEKRDKGEFLLYDLRGRKIFQAALPSSALTIGQQQFPLQVLGDQMPSGIYIAVLNLDGRILAEKLTLIK